MREARREGAREEIKRERKEETEAKRKHDSPDTQRQVRNKPPFTHPPLQHVPEYPNQLSSLASWPVAQNPSFFQLSSHQNYGVS